MAKLVVGLRPWGHDRGGMARARAVLPLSAVLNSVDHAFNSGGDGSNGLRRLSGLMPSTPTISQSIEYGGACSRSTRF